MLTRPPGAVRPLAGMLLTRGIARRVSVVNLVPPAGYPGRGDYIDGEVIDEQVFAPVHQAGIVRRVDAPDPHPAHRGPAD